jgi:low affinity Fe/Cu permease
MEDPDAPTHQTARCRTHGRRASDGDAMSPAQDIDEQGGGTLRDRFNHLADGATHALGSIQAVVLSVVVVVVWALSGPLFGFSDSWQLVINTSTTVITFWMVFVIQNSQGRDARAIHLKLDEIIRANAEARNEFIVAERATEAEVEQHERDLQRVANEAPAKPASATGSDAR